LFDGSSFRNKETRLGVAHCISPIEGVRNANKPFNCVEVHFLGEVGHNGTVQPYDPYKKNSNYQAKCEEGSEDVYSPLATTIPSVDTPDENKNIIQPDQEV